MQDFSNWVAQQAAYLEAEASGESLPFEATSSAELETAAFMSEAALSPAAAIANRSAYNTIQAHSRDLGFLEMTRASYYQRFAEDVTQQKTNLEEKSAILLRLSQYTEGA